MARCCDRGRSLLRDLGVDLRQSGRGADQKISKKPKLLEPVIDHPGVKRLQWFTKDQYKAWESDDQIFLSDLRMGVEGPTFSISRWSKGAGVCHGSFSASARPRLDRLKQV